MKNCKHCRNGFLDNRFGQDVECVNGVLIDIDVYMEGWPRDDIFPVAPCHPEWKRQCAGEDVGSDTQARLLEASLGWEEPETQAQGGL